MSDGTMSVYLVRLVTPDGSENEIIGVCVGPESANRLIDRAITKDKEAYPTAPNRYCQRRSSYDIERWEVQ